MTIIYADEVAQYIARAVEQVKQRDLPGYWTFTVSCTTNPHQYNDLKIEFNVWYDKSSEWITGPSFEDAIAEHLRRAAIRNQLSPLCLPRTVPDSPKPAAEPVPPVLDDEIPF